MDASVRPAWLLNLDAELELKAASAYATTARVRSNVERRFDACDVLTLGEPVVGRDSVDPQHSVFCWCPTPNARRFLAASGLNAVVGPELDVLRQANHRRWLARLQPELLERCFVGPEDDWRRLLDVTSPSGAWRLKRCYGFAGRAQRRVVPPFSPDDLRWISDSLRQGGFLREAEVTVLEEYSLHGYVDVDDLRLGQPVRFATDAFGAPIRTAEPASLAKSMHTELERAARRVGRHLKELGYFGPFGVDAFTWQASPTAVALNAISDVNARFTLAWSLGLAGDRIATLARYATQAAARRE